MRSLLIAVVCLCLLTALVSAASAATVVFEGENYTWIKPSMKVIDSEGASGGKCVYIPLRANHSDTEQPATDDGNITIKGWVPADGTYYLWARVWWYDACGNSFFLFVDNMSADPPPYITGSTYQKWYWMKAPKTYKLTKGWHNFRFQNREDGARLDEFLITTAEDWVPSGAIKPTPGYVWHPE